MIDLKQAGIVVRQAAGNLALLSTEEKNTGLLRVADELERHWPEIQAANAADIQAAETAKILPAMVDRLTLTPKRWQDVLTDLRRVAELPDPVGEIFEEQVREDGLYIQKQRVPLGVLGVIYESRPNVTVDVVGLAIKSGNGVILRGGSETLKTNIAIAAVIHEGLKETAIPCGAVQFIDDPNHQSTLALLQMDDVVDLIIPRGGAGLHQFCKENSHIPVITGGIGICHLYVDASAELARSIQVIRNAKIQRPTVCNALDTVLVQKEIAAAFLPELVKALAADGVRFKADPRAYNLLPHTSGVEPAGPEDFDREWLSLVLGLKVVDNIEEAIAHIHLHSTGHSDGILTETPAHSRQFVQMVDSAAVYVNASTRFTDGAQLGLGAEIAVSTQRLHARGPMGLRELTTYKWVVTGEYHTRAG